MSVRRIATIAAALAGALVVAGCAGSGEKDIAEVEACLQDAGLKVEAFNERDKKVEEGVFATTDLTKGDRDEFAFAVAARVKSEETVEEFQKDTEEFSKTLSVGEQKLRIDSGAEDRYVWVVGGAKQDGAYDEARDCVAP